MEIALANAQIDLELQAAILGENQQQLKTCSAEARFAMCFFCGDIDENENETRHWATYLKFDQRQRTIYFLR